MNVPQMTVQDAADHLANGAVLLDVREQQEWDMAHVDGARLMPMSTLADNIESIPEGRPLLVMCASGGRSNTVSGFLLANGFSDVHNVAGGIQGWAAAGLPYTQ